jgi:hypothetical protein
MTMPAKLRRRRNNMAMNRYEEVLEGGKCRKRIRGTATVGQISGKQSPGYNPCENH